MTFENGTRLTIFGKPIRSSIGHFNWFTVFLFVFPGRLARRLSDSHRNPTSRLEMRAKTASFPTDDFGPTILHFNKFDDVIFVFPGRLGCPLTDKLVVIQIQQVG